MVAGWATDLDADVDSGIDTIPRRAYPVTGADPVFIARRRSAARGGRRRESSERFRNSGYGITVAGLAPGGYESRCSHGAPGPAGSFSAKPVRGATFR